MRLLRPTFLLSLFSLLASSPSVINAYPDHAGTCDVSQMATTSGSPHGTAAAGTGGFSIQSTSTGPGSVKLSLNGSNGIKGLLLYIENGQGQRFGDFGSTLPSGIAVKTDCPSGGTSKSVLQHTGSTVKSLPMTFTWSSSQMTGKATVKAIALMSQNKWYAVPNLSLDLSAAAGNISSTTTASDTTTGTTTGASSSNGNHNFIVAFFINYTLFAFVMGITIFIYIVGALLEVLLKRQAVKSRKYAKTIASGLRVE